jgi:hypothetical protein
MDYGMAESGCEDETRTVRTELWCRLSTCCEDDLFGNNLSVVFRRDGKPYRPQEAAYIQDITRSQILFSGADLTGWRQPHGDWQVAEGSASIPLSPRRSSSCGTGIRSRPRTSSSGADTFGELQGPPQPGVGLGSSSDGDG